MAEFTYTVYGHRAGKRETIATFDDYMEAARLVDHSERNLYIDAPRYACCGKTECVCLVEVEHLGNGRIAA